MSRLSAPLLAGLASLALLAGCSEEPRQTGAPQAEEPAATAPADQEPDGMQRLRDGLDTLQQEAERLGGDIRQQAQEIIDNPDPYLEQAREIGGRIGQSVDEIIRQAAEDLQRGVAALEERIAAATGEPRPAAEGDARLAPIEELDPDTSAAARAHQAGVGPDYVGVWAGSAEDCGLIDREPVEMFAVITPTTIRRYESLCNFVEQPVEGGRVTLSAECTAEGEMEERAITLTLPSSEELRMSYDGAEGGAELLRCHLPR